MSKPSTDPGDHWRRLAAELGLEVEPNPPASAEPEPPPQSSPSPAFRDEEPPVEFVAAESRSDLPIDTTPYSEPAPPEPVEFTETFAAELDDVEPLHIEAAAEAEDGEKPRRRRRRPRRKKDEESTTEPAVETVQAEPGEDEGDTPAEAVKDWDIPSWNELIASLYRPDR